MEVKKPRTHSRECIIFERESGTTTNARRDGEDRISLRKFRGTKEWTY